MRRLSTSLFMGLTLALMLAIGGCSDGGTNPEDGGIDGGDGGNVECTSAAQCDDENPCTDDTCVQGKCVNTNNTAPCDDGQACSENDVCSDGVCSGTAVGCDDGNPCTNDSCDDSEGCVYIPNSAPCDDDNACTIGDVCSNGSCVGGDALTCDDGNECTDDSCDPASGCVYSPNSNECDDGQACSSNDHCSNGVCVGDSSVDCDDNNPCTEDSCDDSLGCVHSFNIAPCDDENACTENDACDQGSCHGTALNCDDGNDCTTDSCDVANGCQHENNTDPCDDGDDCTVGDTCADGACQAGAARDCDDHEDCTDDSCVQGLGCVHANNTASCDDGNACTDGDHCQAGQCVSGEAAFDCDDGDPCTDDTCDPVNGCSHTYNTSPCDDGDSCTTGDTCSNGVCSGLPKDADSDGYIDENCGGDDCNDDVAAINPGAFEGPAGDPVCSDGVDNNCNQLSDAQDPGCNTCGDDSDCDDGNVCNGTETCSAGSCVAGTALNCDSGNPCTTDTCDPVSGCQHANNTAPCDDGNACTTGDVCSGGTCQAGAGTLTCDDSNPCTDDSCVPATGCVFANNTAPCDDGDPCSTGDTCSGGTCQAGAGTLDCNDNNDCTDDSCVANQGCVNTANDSNTCDDGNGCTSSDHCSGGICVGTGISCDDSNICTDDSCDPQLGCVHTNNSEACNDGDACTENDMCVGGNCTGTIRDQDSDGYGDGTGACTGDDCDDSNPDINPGATEACDGIDNNCNRIIDEGCASCDTAVPEGLLQIDNGFPLTSYGLNAGDEAINAFFINSSSYNAISVDVYFYDFSGGSGNAQGSYSLHVYADNDGLPGTELASAGPDTVTEAWDAPHTFTLSSPVGFTNGELLWVGVRSEADQTTNLFLPLMDGGIADTYAGGVLKQQSDGQYYGVLGNWLIRVQGCGEGPWLELSDHAESQTPLPAGGSITSTATLKNRGFDDSATVSGVLSSGAPEMVLTSDTANFGTITAGATAAGSPAYGISADATAYGIYGMVLNSSDGPNSWVTSYGVYVQGSGCVTENHVLATDNDTPKYIIPPAAGDETGNYFVVDSTSFAMTSADVSFLYNNSSGSGTGTFRLKVYTYQAGYPDKLIYQSNWQSVTANGGGTPTVETFSLPTPLTFKTGDTFFVVVESQTDLSATDFAVLSDDGDTQNNSQMNGYLWDESEGTWSPIYSSFIIKVNGCQSTELVYDSLTSTPDPIQKGQSATLNITVKNDGAQDATGVTGTLSSSDPDVTVTTATRSFGTVSAGSTATANGFVINVSASADAFQYVLDLELTDGTTTWNDQVPIQLAGGTKNISIQNFTATLVGNDIQYHWDVVNTGNVDVINSFQVDLYTDRASAPGVGDAGDWSDNPTGLAVGESKPYDLVWQNAPNGSYTAWVQADTNDAIAESDETDNVDGPQPVTVGDATTFELLDPPRKWFDSDMPVGFRFVANNYEGDLGQTSTRDAIRNGFDQWQNVATATITFNELSQASAGSGGFINDGYNTMSFEDPDGELASGVLGATLPIYNSQTTTTNGVTFYRITDADIVFNDGVPFVRNGDPCSNQMDLDGVATHEEGHLLGLDHPDVFNATMYYAVDYCDMSKVSLAESDINGVSFIYPQ